MPWIKVLSDIKFIFKFLLCGIKTNPVMVPSLWILSIPYPYITMEPEPGTNEMK